MSIEVAEIGLFLTGGGSGYHYAPFGTFNGTSDFVSVAHSSAFDVTNFSLSAWFRTSKDYTIAAIDGTIISKGGVGFDPPNNTFGMRVFKDTNMIRAGFETSDGTDHEPSSSPITVNDGVWHHCVVTNDGFVVRLYLEGVQIKQHTYNPPDAHVPELNSEPLVIGRNSNDSSRFFEGDIDEVRVWNSVLTPAEVLNLYQSGIVPQTGNIVYTNTFGGSGTVVTDPNTSLGGNLSPTQVVSNNLHNLFRRITDSEASSGVTLYRCVAIKNLDPLLEMRNVVFYMVTDTKSVDSLALYSKAQAGKNTPETPIVNEFTTPPGSNISFIAVLNRSGGLQLGDLSAGEYINLWLRYTVNPGAISFPNDEWRIRAEVGSSATSTPPTPEPDPDTGVNFEMQVIADCSCSSNFTNMWSRMKNRGPEFVLFNGDLSYNSGASCWLSATSSFRSKSMISIGNHDGDEDHDQPETKNALINAYSYLAGKTYGKKTFNNVGIINMESGSDQTVSDSIGSAQYNFVKAALEGFKADSSIEWIFVMNHYPFYGPDSDHANNSGGRDRYDPLFDANGVDAVFHGHNHNIWHSNLIRYNSGSPSNPIQAGTDPNYSYSKASANHGKLYIGSGAGGRSHYDINSTPSYVMYDNDSNFAYLHMEFSNSGKKITFKFYSSSDSLLNTFTLTHT